MRIRTPAGEGLGDPESGAGGRTGPAVTVAAPTGPHPQGAEPAGGTPNQRCQGVRGGRRGPGGRAGAATVGRRGGRSREPGGPSWPRHGTQAAGDPVAEAGTLRWQVKAVKAQAEQTCWRGPGGHPPEEAASHSGWQLLEPSRPRGLSFVQAGESQQARLPPPRALREMPQDAELVSAGNGVRGPVRSERP